MNDDLGLRRGFVTVGLLVAVTGCGDSGNGSTSGASSDSGTTGGTGETTTTGAGTTTDAPTGSGTDSATGTTTTGGATSGSTSSTTGGSTSSTTTGGVDVPPACQSYGDKVTECYDARVGMAAATYCGEKHEYYSMNFGPMCVAALEDFMVCLSQLSCAEFTGPDPVCVAKSDALSAACAGP